MKRIEKKIENSSVKPITGERILNKLYSVLLVGLCWFCASFCETGWRCILDVCYLTVTENKSRDSWKDDIASSFNISTITGYVAQAFEELYYGK